MSKFLKLWQLPTWIKLSLLLEQQPNTKPLRKSSNLPTSCIYSYDFVPIAVETLGLWSSDALTFVKQLGTSITENTGDNQETAYLL